MRRYWDSSALVDALEDGRVEALAREKDQFTRSHTLAEIFSTITGGRLGYRYDPADASALIADITAEMTFVEMSAKEVQVELDRAAQFGVRGGNVHDYLHARAAAKAKVAVLVTYNLSDFENLKDGFMVESP